MSDNNVTYPFLKMHGLGNDFVIFDARINGLQLSDAQVRAIADRRRGVGCDQLIFMRHTDSADVFMEIRNADGSRVGACGNATRCVGQIMLDESAIDKVMIATDSGELSAERAKMGIAVNMGPARLEASEIPLSRDEDTLHVNFELGSLKDPVCINMGNPHAVFFVDNAEKIDLEYLGPKIEHDPLFPQRVNVSVVSRKTNGTLRQRVWERGVGITDACGSGACAALVAAARRKLTGRKSLIELDGGLLEIEWLDDGTVMMSGAATLSYEGRIAL